MKKILFLFTTAILYITTTWSQEWNGFGRSVPTEPEIIVTRSDNQQVTFTVNIFGFFSETKNNNGKDYSRLSIPGCGKTGNIGTPEIPIITHLIAIPECSDIYYNIQIDETQILNNITVYPSPSYQEQAHPSGYTKVEEVFTINPIAYQQTTPTPKTHFLSIGQGFYVLRDL